MGSNTGKPISTEKLSQLRQLRSEGNSVKQIAKMLGVSVGTASKYCASLQSHTSTVQKLTQQMRENQAKLNNLAMASTVMSRINANRREQAKIDAIIEWPKVKFDPAIIALVMGYWAEGNKRSSNEFSVINSDPGFINVMILGLKTIGVKEDMMSPTIVTYPSHNITDCITKWSEAIRLSITKFQVRQWYGKKQQIYSRYGLCRLRVKKSRLLFIRIMTWIDEWRHEQGLHDNWQVTKTERAEAIPISSQ